MLCTTKSFGVRFLSPVAPRTREGFLKTAFIGRDYKKTSKPDYNNSKQDPDVDIKNERDGDDGE